MTSSDNNIFCSLISSVFSRIAIGLLLKRTWNTLSKVCYEPWLCGVYDKTVQNLLIQPNDLFVQCRENSSLTNYGLWGFFRTIIFHMNTPTIRADDVALNNSKEKVNWHVDICIIYIVSTSSKEENNRYYSNQLNGTCYVSLQNLKSRCGKYLIMLYLE